MWNMRPGTKRFIICSALCLVCLCASGQKHVRFEGVSLGQNYNSFCDSLYEKGFRHKSRDLTEPYLKGKHLSEKAELAIVVTPKSHSVYMVIASFPQKKTWAPLKTGYDMFKMKLHALYGDPVKSEEFFASPLAEESPMLALMNSNCTFVSSYLVPGGEVILSISKKACIELFYIDYGTGAAYSEEIF